MLKKRIKEEGKRHGAFRCFPFQVLALSLLLFAVVMASGPASAVVNTVTLEFESQALDLETGLVVERSLRDLTPPEGADVYMAYNADRTPHAVVITVGNGTEIAFVPGIAFALVTAADIVNLSFSNEPPDVPFAPTDTVVIRTSDGQVNKLGNCEETESWVTFDYEPVQ